MRLFLSCVCVVVLVLMLVGCGQPTETHAPPRRSELLVPAAGDGIVLARTEAPSVSIQADDDDDSSPRVSLSDEYNLLSTYNVNLDLEEPDEQIIVVKRRDDPTDRIRLLVAVFDPLRNSYRLTWEGSTLATGVRSFAVYTMDVIGDHQEEIVAVGTDNDGNQTTNVFRRQDIGEGRTTLTYYEIFGESVDGSVEIDEQRRTEGYRTLQSAGASFPIVAYQRNDQTEDPLDLLRTKFRWSAENARYIIYEVEEVPSVDIEQEQLRDLFNADAAMMESFLSGPWFRSTGDSIGSSVELAHFDPRKEELILFNADAQERYDWLNSYKTLYAGGPGLLINTQNQVLRTIRRQISVTAVGVDTIRLNVDGVEYWNGTYRRMTPGIQQSVIRRYDTRQPDFRLDGVYRNESDEEILFDDPHFRLRTNGLDWSGGFNLIQLEMPVLEFKVLQSNGPTDRGAGTRDATGQNGMFNARYRIDYSEQRSEDRIVRRIDLRPVIVTVDGVEMVGGDTITLEQVEEFLLDD